MIRVICTTAMVLLTASGAFAGEGRICLKDIDTVVESFEVELPFRKDEKAKIQHMNRTAFDFVKEQIVFNTESVAFRFEF